MSWRPLLSFLYYIYLIFCIPINNSSEENGWTLRIVHTNDMHARFDEISATGSECLLRDKKLGKCYGGFARIATLVRQARNSTVPTLYLDAGDTYQGTPWFGVYKWRIVSKFLNFLQPDVVSLGNHEFDNGPKGLVPFIKASTFPIVSCNLNLTDEPKLAAAGIKKSIILNMGNQKIGIIGYLTPTTKMISSTGNVIFSDEVESIREEVRKLQAENVSILIALGHSGFNVDQKIAAEVDGLDLVIGGHTDTFLYSGTPPDIEVAENTYPTVIEQKSGRQVYVVQAYTFTKYLGNLIIDFDESGEIRNISGNPILVDNSVEKAEDVVDELEKWRPGVANITRRALGYSRVLLYHNPLECRLIECNFGNMITDAMVEFNSKDHKSDTSWTDAAIAIIGSGSVKMSINKTATTAITFGDILTALPHLHAMLKLEITGEQIMQILEHSVDVINPNGTNPTPSGQFLHYSGLKVLYDLSKPKNSKVVSVSIRCADCLEPKFEEIQNNKTYKILTSDYLRGGGDGYEILNDLKWTVTGWTIEEVVAQYIEKKGIVDPKVENRILFT